MSNEELIKKANKDLNSLTIHELRRLSNLIWKIEIFSLNKLVNYVQTTEDIYLNTFLQKCHLDKSVITTKWLTTNCKPEELKKQAYNKELKKFYYTDEKRTKFGIWFITGVIQKFAAEVQARAQSSHPKKIEVIKDPSLIAEAKKEVEKTASIVAQNKKRNKEKREAKKLTEVKIEEKKTRRPSVKKVV